MSDFGAWHSFVVLPRVLLVCLHVPQAAPSVILWWHPELRTKCHHIHAVSWWCLSSTGCPAFQDIIQDTTRFIAVSTEPLLHAFIVVRVPSAFRVPAFFFLAFVAMI